MVIADTDEEDLVDIARFTAWIGDAAPSSEHGLLTEPGSRDVRLRLRVPGGVSASVGAEIAGLLPAEVAASAGLTTAC